MFSHIKIVEEIEDAKREEDRIKEDVSEECEVSRKEKRACVWFRLFPRDMGEGQ